MKASIALALAALALGACATSTTFKSTWKAPDAGVLNPEGHRVAAVYITSDESSRREAEDTLVERLNAAGAQGVASYTLVPGSETKNIDSVRERLASAGVDGAVVMRVIDTKDRVRYSPEPAFAPYYRHFWGYWGYGWGAAYSPTRVDTDEVVSVETQIYSIRRDELLWAGTSRTVNPSKVKDFVNEVADAATKEMRKDGLLAQRS
jgi:hypothetical protein